MDVTVDYRLVGTGWSECTVEVDGQKCTVTASYLSDALRELVDGTHHVLARGAEARFRFDEEPGEYRWILSSTPAQGIRIRILEFQELWGEKPDSEGELLFDATCPARVFGEALLLSLNRLLDEHGLAGYQQQWVEAAFPRDDYLKLCALLGAAPSPIALKVEGHSS